MDEQQFMMNAQREDAAMQMGRTNYMNPNQADLNSLLSELTNPENQILEVEMSLKGKQINEKGEYVQVSKPLLNDEGVANMLRIIRTMVSRVMFVSNLTEEQVAKLTIALGRSICKDITMNGIKYNIDPNDRETIVNIILYPSFESANSALENGFRRFLKSGIIETTINTQGQPMKQGKGSGGIAGLL